MSADLPTIDYLDELVDTDPAHLLTEAIALRARAERAEAAIARLYPAIECVLIDHADQLTDDHGRVDANLAELAHVYRELTGFNAHTACQQEHPTAPTP
ncbi:MAG: hypothetical protein IRZ07_28320 [Microbispora sp.]|nr:hypothetical protein [Microbispora sp.]